MGPIVASGGGGTGERTGDGEGVMPVVEAEGVWGVGVRVAASDVAVGGDVGVGLGALVAVGAGGVGVRVGVFVAAGAGRVNVGTEVSARFASSARVGAV
jgi:hypothetical protein